MTQAFLPALTRSRGAIVNILSVMALAPLPLIPAYSISKAAAFYLTQSLRALLAGRGVGGSCVLAGPVDTDMTRGLDIPKASPESVARAIFDGVENGRRTSSPIPRRRPWPMPGTTGRPRPSNARTRRWHKQHSARHKQTETLSPRISGPVRLVA